MEKNDVFIKDVIFSLRNEYVNLQAILEDIKTHFKMVDKYSDSYLFLKKGDNSLELYMHLVERMNKIRAILDRLLVLLSMKDPNFQVSYTNSDRINVSSKYYETHENICLGMKVSSLLRSKALNNFEGKVLLTSEHYDTLLNIELNRMLVEIYDENNRKCSLEYSPRTDTFVFTPTKGMDSKLFLLEYLYSPIFPEQIPEEYKNMFMRSMASECDVVVQNGDFSLGKTTFAVEDFKKAYVLGIGRTKRP